MWMDYFLWIIFKKVCECDKMMLGLLTSDFGYQNRLTLLQQLIECGDVLLGRELSHYGVFIY